MISPFSARQAAWPSLCQPVSEEPLKTASGRKFWLAAKIAAKIAAPSTQIVPMLFLDITTPSSSYTRPLEDHPQAHGDLPGIECTDRKRTECAARAVSWDQSRAWIIGQVCIPQS